MTSAVVVSDKMCKCLKTRKQHLPVKGPSSCG